jgi:toxin-antitoxin system PIN domain toxin
LVVLGFIRISTNTRLTEVPLSVAQAFDHVEEWLSAPLATLIHPQRRHLVMCRELLERSGTGGNLTSDAHLAALAIERDATLASFDGDFHRFTGLDFEYLGAGH